MECASTIALAYGAFSESLHAKARKNRIPLSGSIEVTMRCNVRCQHCYIPLSRRAGGKQGELSLAEYERIFSELADAGMLFLLLTGGEPFLRRDFLEIYDAARRKGFLTTVFTNGTLLTEAIVDHLADWRPFSIEISLYGATQETYERVTGIPGSFSRCRQGIDMLLARGLPLKLKTVLMSLNQHELQAMQQFTQDLGLEFSFDPVINAGIDGSQHPTQYRLSPEQIIQIEMADPGRSKRWPETFDTLKDVDVFTNKMYTCSAGQSSFHIDAQGKMSLCISARSPAIDLREHSFADGWNRFLPGVKAMEYKPGFGCSSCALRKVCAQCPAMALTELGDVEARVPFLCDLAHLRQQAFELQPGKRQ